jgi:hypothetical protein
VGTGTEILPAMLKIITAIGARLKFEEVDISDRTCQAMPWNCVNLMQGHTKEPGIIESTDYRSSRWCL